MSNLTSGAEEIATWAVPIADLDDRTHLCEIDGATALRGAECGECGKRSFPVSSICCCCGSRDVAEVGLASTGSLYTFSTVHVSSSRTVPYTLGYIDLDDGVRVLGELRGTPNIGCKVRLEAELEAWFFVTMEACQ